MPIAKTVSVSAPTERVLHQIASEAGESRESAIPGELRANGWFGVDVKVNARRYSIVLRGSRETQTPPSVWGYVSDLPPARSTVSIGYGVDWHDWTALSAAIGLATLTMIFAIVPRSAIMPLGGLAVVFAGGFFVRYGAKAPPTSEERFLMERVERVVSAATDAHGAG